MILPPELHDKILSFLDKEISALYSCTLVCRDFNKVATPLLYKRIHVSPPKVGLAWQIVEDTLGRKPFAASRLPSHVGYVGEFILDGYLTKIRPSRQTPVPIIDKIPDALRMWQNLQSVTLTPQKVTGAAILNLVKALRDCPSLKAVTVNESAMDEDVMPDLAEIIGLRELTLLHPTRALFMVLRDWLARMRDTLLHLYLLGNCGSLTPGILRAITPQIMNLHSLAIGLSYSLTDTDVFTCLSQLSELTSLRIRYYRQHRKLPPGPTLPALKYLTVLHTPVLRKEDADALSTWLRRISSSSPLETLDTICTDTSGPSLCFDGLISHVAHRHCRTLCTLRMSKAYVREPALRLLLTKCINLEHLELTVAFTTLQAFPTMTDGCTKLRTVSLDVCDHRKLVIEKKDTQKVLQRVPQLRDITVNNVTWKGEWVAQRRAEGHVAPEFMVTLMPNVVRDLPLGETWL